MRGVLALFSLVLLFCAVVLTPDTRDLDRVVIDASLAESATYMEAETLPPRYLAYLRCAIDQWLVENDERELEMIDLPDRVPGSEWAEEVEEDARCRGAEVEMRVDDARLSENKGGTNPEQNVPFAGEDKRGAIRVTSHMSFKIKAERGLAAARALRDVAIDVCHPLLYFLIVDAHAEAEEALAGVVPNQTSIDAGKAKNYEEAMAKIEETLAEVEAKVIEVEARLIRKYAPKALIISFELEMDLSYTRHRGLRHDLVSVDVRLLVKVIVSDPEVRYWHFRMHRGWSCWAMHEYGFNVALEIGR